MTTATRERWLVRWKTPDGVSVTKTAPEKTKPTQASMALVARTLEYDFGGRWVVVWDHEARTVDVVTA